MLLEQVGILRMLKRAGGLIDRNLGSVSLDNRLLGMLTNSEDAYDILANAYDVSGDDGLKPLLKRLNYVVGHMDSAIDRKDFDEYLVDEFSAYLEDLSRDVRYYADGKRG